MKYANMALGLVLVVVGLGAGVYLYEQARVPASGAHEAPTGAGVPLTQLISGTQSSVATRTNYLITSRDELRELWKIIGAAGAPPTVDFSTQSVIAVFAGNEPTAGYDIKVTKVTDGEKRMVSVGISQPGVSCLAAETLTTPYQVLELPATTLTLTHEDIATTTGCLQ